MSIGNRLFFAVAADIVRTSSAALVTTGLKSAIAANKKQYLRAWIPVTVGATGGLRLQIVVPAGGTLFLASIRLNNTVAPSITEAVQKASAAFTNALANAGDHWLEVEAEIQNGVTAGDVDIQMGQNTSDPLSLTILKGGHMEVTVES
jgi:hypothetical protein